MPYIVVESDFSCAHLCYILADEDTFTFLDATVIKAVMITDKLFTIVDLYLHKEYSLIEIVALFPDNLQDALRPPQVCRAGLSLLAAQHARGRRMAGDQHDERFLFTIVWITFPESSLEVYLEKVY